MNRKAPINFNRDDTEVTKAINNVECEEALTGKPFIFYERREDDAPLISAF